MSASSLTPLATHPSRWPWPMPALALWALAWALYGLAQRWFEAPAALGLACAFAFALAVHGDRPWRRLVMAGGFPMSALAGGLAADLPSWLWLIPLALLALLYPLRAWRDAPLFPTPPHSLDMLAARLPLAAGARVLDAGCGAGDGLRALHSAWPQAQVEGIEWSRPLAAWSAWRCRGAQVRQGDMWRASWAAFDLVYVFQRPESMARAWAKACADMRPGSWLVSLEFVVPGRPPELELALGADRSVRAWRVPAQPGAPGADKHR